MENAAEALKIAGFTLLFVTALTIAMVTVMQGKDTSEKIIGYSDKTKYYSYVDEDTSNVTDDNGNRIVTVYDIIPTLYRYRSEQYIVLFEGIEPFYKTINKKKEEKFTQNIKYLNYNLEDKMQAHWRQNEKEHVKDVAKFLLDNYSDSKFVETLTTTDNTYFNNVGENVQENSTDKGDIRVITYTKK